MKDLLNLLSKVSSSLRQCTDEIDSFLNGNNFELLKGLLLSEEWPKAAHEDQICDFGSERELGFRAKNILNIFDLDEGVLSGKRFLDFGCGNGFTAKEAANRGAVSFGYDIEQRDLWREHKGVNIFSDWYDVQKEIKLNGKFDYVLLYDVLDHIDGELIESVVSKVYDACSGLAFVRCHPFCSRHGYHLHRLMNKAFVHLIFSPQELHSLGFSKVEHTLCMVEVEGYLSLFVKKFRILSDTQVKDPVDKFFYSNPFILDRISKNWFGNADRSKVLFNMSHSFLDFVLKPIEPFTIPR